jgi:predicted TPR repeat methyltransferase
MSQVDSLFFQASYAHQQGDSLYAKQCYEKLLKDQPKHMQAMYGLGLLAAENQQWDNAIFWMKKALRVTPNSACLHLHLANVLKKNGQVEAAITHYQSALNCDPNYAEAYNNYGALLFKQNQIVQARQHYEQAIQLKPDYLEAHFNLGLLFVAQAEKQAAITQFTRVLALEPSAIAAHWQLAAIYWQDNELEKVTAHYQMLLQLTPHSVELLNNLGACALKQNQLEKAIEYFTRALSIEPQHKNARNNLAASLLQKNLLKEAIWHYSLYLTLEPNDKEALYNRANSFMLIGQLHKALHDLKKVVEIDEKHIDAYCNLAAIYLKLNDTEIAIKTYQHVLLLQKAHPIASYMLSTLTQQSIPPIPPLDYIKNLFDNYAFQFDSHLKEVLHYKTPELLRKQITPYLQEKKYKVLDLGCGTGLSGVPFADIAVKLTGIDVSRNMLAQAHAKHCYDELIENDILHGLSDLLEDYDLILAMDTLVYFGELNELFSKIVSCLKPTGLFAFSIELADKSVSTYCLQTSGRYQHTCAYIEKLAEKNHFNCLKQSVVDGRYQANKSVKTGLFVLQKHEMRYTIKKTN